MGWRGWITGIVAAGTVAGPVAGQELGSPSGLALAPSGRAVTVADRRTHRVLDVDLTTGAVSVVAGTGAAGFSGDGGPATEASLRNPEWVDYDRAGNLYIADRGNARIRRVDAVSGVISTVVGTGAFGYDGDGGPAVDASLTAPFGVAVGPDDDLYVFDTEAHVIRHVDAATGVISTVVGDGHQGFGGDGGPGTGARLSRPHNGVFDRAGRLVFGDSFNHRIRVWDPAVDRIETVAGIGREGAPRLDVPALESPFRYFGGMAVEPNGDLVFTSLDDRILRLDVGIGRLQVVAGTGVAGDDGDGGPARDARFRLPYGLVRTPAGDLVVADAGNARIRIIEAGSGRIRTLAGGS